MRRSFKPILVVCKDKKIHLKPDTQEFFESLQSSLHECNRKIKQHIKYSVQIHMMIHGIDFGPSFKHVTVTETKDNFLVNLVFHKPAK